MKDNVNFDSIIENFPSYTKEHLESMKNDLKLSMPVQMLDKTRIQYANRERRDIPLGELFFLDFLSSLGDVYYENIIIDELLTDNENAMKTFANLNKKRCTLSERTYPFLLSEVAAFANKYLAKKNIKAPQFPIQTEVTDLDKPPFSLFLQGVFEHEIINTEGESLHFALCKNRKSQNILSPSTLFLISPKSNTNKDNYEKEISKFLCSRFSDMFYYINILDCYGVMPPIIKSGLSFQLDLVSMANVLDIAPTLPNLTRAGEGCMLLAAQFLPDTSLGAIRDFYDFNITKIGNTAHIPHDSFKISEYKTINIEASFLQSFIQKSTKSAKLVKTDLTGSNDFKEQRIIGSVVTVNNTSYEISYSNKELVTSIYKDTIETMCKAMLSQIARGKNINEIQMNIEFPQISQRLEPTQLGNIMSAFLALYRLQIELVLPLNIKFKSVKTSSLWIKALSVTEKSERADNLIANGGGKIYCLEALKDKNGLCDFDDLRRLIQYIIYLVNDNCTVIYSPATSIKETIESACDSNITVDYNYNFEDKPLSIYSFLVVSDKNIEGNIIGRTYKNL